LIKSDLKSTNPFLIWEENGIQRQLTVRYTPRRNSVADRKNHTLEANGIEQQLLYQVISSVDGMEDAKLGSLVSVV
jgi:hypothetical protein